VQYRSIHEGREGSREIPVIASTMACMKMHYMFGSSVKVLTPMKYGHSLWADWNSGCG